MREWKRGGGGGTDNDARGLAFARLPIGDGAVAIKECDGWRNYANCYCCRKIGVVSGMRVLLKGFLTTICEETSQGTRIAI